MKLKSLIARNCKVYFREKSVFFTSLIAPLILLFLYITFLGSTYSQSLNNMVEENFGITLDAGIVKAFAGGWLMSSLLAVCAVSIAFTANMVMVQDKVTGRLDDFLVSPVPKSFLALGYYISTALVTFAVCGVALVAGFIYLAIIGWYMSAADVFLALLDTFLLVMFGTALSSLVCSAIKSQGGISAVQVIISAAYGFFCGAYMPIGSISEWLSSILKFFPGTYGTMLLHEHFMGASIDAMPDIPGLKEAVRLSFDCKVEFFGHAVAPWVCYLVIALSTLLIAGAYVLLLSLKGRKKKQSQGKLMDGNRLNI